MTFRSVLGAGRRMLLRSFYAQNIPLGDVGPIVSFTFDDFPRTAGYTAGAILESFGARGTYYVTPGLMETTNELGDICSTEDVTSLLERGHEIGSQTMHHLSGRAVSARVFREDVSRGRATVEKMTGMACPNFSYPYGHATLGTKKMLGAVVTSSRSVIPGLNGPRVDLNLLRANRIYGDIDQAPAIQRLIDENVAKKSWLIFYTHDVRPNPSEYGCTPELFEFAVAATAKSTAKILSASQLLQELRPATNKVLRTLKEPAVTKV